ncbi:MAG: hypothetical protein HC854_07870 [Flavobacterium sp.]|nr:hypothetical protein [Flavobacterium sp.]
MKKEKTNKNALHAIVNIIQVISLVFTIIGLNSQSKSKPPKNAFLDDIHKHMAKVKLEEMKVKNEKNKNAIAFDSIFKAMKNKK